MTSCTSRCNGWLWASGIAALGFFATTVWFTAPLDPSGPALQLTFDADSFNAILTRWQADGIARFRAHFVFDFPFLISYGCFGYLLSRRTSLFATYAESTRRHLAWLLPIAALLDATENCLHLYLLDAAAPADMLYPLAGSVASAKWLLSAGFIVIALYALLRRLVRSR